MHLLKDIEDYIANNEMLRDYDIIEECDDYRIISPDYQVLIPELNITLKEGVFENWNYDTEEYEADFCITLIYEDMDMKQYAYYEQDDFNISLANYLGGKFSPDELEKLECKLIVNAEHYSWI